MSTRVQTRSVPPINTPEDNNGDLAKPVNEK